MACCLTDVSFVLKHGDDCTAAVVVVTVCFLLSGERNSPVNISPARNGAAMSRCYVYNVYNMLYNVYNMSGCYVYNVYNTLYNGYNMSGLGATGTGRYYRMTKLMADVDVRVQRSWLLFSCVFLPQQAARLLSLLVFRKTWLEVRGHNQNSDRVERSAL